MIRFSARDANLLLVAHGRALVGEGWLQGQGAYRFFFQTIRIRKSAQKALQ